MRDLILLGFTGACLVAALRYPYAGLLTWAWFAIMTPHQIAYGLYGVPLNTVIAGVAIFAYVVSGEVAKFRFDWITSLIVLLAGWLTVSQAFSLDAANSVIYYERFLKTLLFIVLCAQMASGKLRFNALVWVLVAGIGYFAFKGAVFTVVTLGRYHVQGMPMTVLEDNNHFGIAVATILPLILYLRGESARPFVRTGLLALFCCSVVAIIGTQSRGAFLSLLVFASYFWLRSKYKLTIMAGMTLLLVPTIAFMPSKWSARMTTITEATQDESFMGRVDAWVINYKLAKQHPLTGAGLRNSYQKKIAETVDRKRAPRAKAAHSIYFEILGGSGFIGLIIYLSLFATAFFSAWRVYLSRKNPTLAPWKWNFAYYAQMSLAVFAVGGASTSMEMWDGYLIVIALIAALMKTAPAELRKPGHALEAIRKRNWRRKKRLQGLIDQPAS